MYCTQKVKGVISHSDKWSFLKQNIMDWFGQASARSAFPFLFVLFEWHSRPWLLVAISCASWDESSSIPKKVSAEVHKPQGLWDLQHLIWAGRANPGRYWWFRANERRHHPKKPYNWWSQGKILAKKCQVCLILIVAVALIVQPTISRLWIMNHIGKL